MAGYDSGVLIWVDDDFEHDELIQTDREIDVWKHIFGDIDSRVYWMLNLRLEIATCASDAIKLLNELTQPGQGNCLVVGVLDMRIPSHPGGIAEKKFGLNVATAFAKLNVPFSILSSKLDAQKDLLNLGLEGTHYYNKQPAPNQTMMPDDLARRVLSQFHSQISWINLKPLQKNWDPSPQYPNPLQLAGDSKYIFPFFSSSRDFLERWEGRQATLLRSRTPRIVLRAPHNHSDEFILQCISLIIAKRNIGRDVQVCYVHANSPDAAAVLSSTGSNLVRVVRFHGETDEQTQQELEVMRSLLNRHEFEQLFFVLPLDERADAFLSTVATETDVLFDDLPAVRISDFQERENLIRRIIRYLLQNLRLEVDGGTNAYVNSFYLDHPEALFHPLSWTFLLEAEEIADDLSDPYEMVTAISAEIDRMTDWPGHLRQCLIDGTALPIDHLLRPASDLYQRQISNHPAWIKAAMRDWLAKSWRTPYGCIDMRRVSLPEAELIDWETLCLEVCCDLAASFLSIAPESRKDNAVLTQAARFLEADAIRKLIAGDVADADWLGLESLRWPHASCPMPAALNRRLKNEGRYLFVQTDVLDRAMLTRKGTRFLLRLEEYAEAQGARLDFLRRNVAFMPKGWREASQSILEFIEAGGSTGVDIESESKKVEVSIWPSLLSFSKNATIVSFLFHALKRHGGELNGSDLEAILGKSAQDTGGEGRLLGVIRGYRAKTLASGAMPGPAPQRNVARDLTQLRAMSQGLIAFTEHETHDGFNQMNHSLSELVAQFGNLQGGFDENFDIEDLEAWLTQTESLLASKIYSDKTSLQTSKFFDTAFEMPSASASLPIAHGTLRGTGLDLLLWLFEWSDLAFWYLRNLQYRDGYHFLSLIRDQRNVDKDTIAMMSDETLSTINEMFLIGFEGFLFQLRECLIMLGETDLASKFVGMSPFDADETKPSKTLADVLTVRTAKDGYELFAKGFPGKERRNFSYVDHNLQMIRLQSKDS